MRNVEPDDHHLERWLLDRGLTCRDLRTAATIQTRLKQNPAFARRLHDYDKLRRLLRSGVSPAVKPPRGGWRAFEQRLIDATLSSSGHPPRPRRSTRLRKAVIALGGAIVLLVVRRLLTGRHR